MHIDGKFTKSIKLLVSVFLLNLRQQESGNLMDQSICNNSDNKFVTQKYAHIKKTYAHLPLNKYQSDIYSQNGEDGVISEILQRLKTSEVKEWCVEFGAWDGKHLSNTFALVKNQNYQAIYIESDNTRFKDLLVTSAQNPRIIPICKKISRVYGSENSLDSILGTTLIPKDFALLSIDVDGYDLDIWESLTNYQPLVVVIEINSNVLPGIIWRHSSTTPGNTFTATLNVAKEKGYALVCHTGNLIFVRNDHVQQLNIGQRFISFPELLFLFEAEWFPKQICIQKKEKPFRLFCLRLGVKIIPKSCKDFLKRVFKSFGLNH